jgi:hypothetical protein
MIKRIIDKIFRSNKNKLFSNKLIFEITDDNNIKVDFLFNDPNIDSPEKIGQFLYCLNSGYYMTRILDMLVSLSRQKPEYEFFVHNIIQSWSQNIPSKSSVEEKPIVSPTYFQKHILDKKI